VSVRGILVRDPGRELVIRPTDGDVEQFGRAGSHVTVTGAVHAGRASVISYLPGGGERQRATVAFDDHPGGAPDRVTLGRGSLWLREAESVQRIADHARQLDPVGSLYDKHGNVVALLESFEYRQSQAETGGRLADPAAVMGGTARYVLTAVGPWRWR
jgi:hypothetical protein